MSKRKSQFRVAYAAARRLVANDVPPAMMSAAINMAKQPDLRVRGRVDLSTIRDLLSFDPEMWDIYKMGLKARLTDASLRKPPLPLP